MGGDLTAPEQAMRDILDRIGVEYDIDYPVGKRPEERGERKHMPFKADFRIPPDVALNDSSRDIMLEVAGEQPHSEAKDGTIPPPDELTERQRYNAHKDLRKSDRYRREGYTHVRVPGGAVLTRPKEVERRLRRVLKGNLELVRGEWLVNPTEPYPDEDE